MEEVLEHDSSSPAFLGHRDWYCGILVNIKHGINQLVSEQIFGQIQITTCVTSPCKCRRK